jgi:hypothetical protein
MFRLDHVDTARTTDEVIDVPCEFLRDVVQDRISLSCERSQCLSDSFL